MKVTALFFVVFGFAIVKAQTDQVKVRLSVWNDNPVTTSYRQSVYVDVGPEPPTLYEAFFAAARANSRFRFTGRFEPFVGFRFTKIGNFGEVGDKTWHVYQSDSPFSTADPPTSDLLYTGGADNLEITDGHYYLTWLKEEDVIEEEDLMDHEP